MGSLSLLQQIFLIQESNQGLLHCMWIHYRLSYQGSPGITGGCLLSLLQQIFLIQESNQGLLHSRWILYQLSYQGNVILVLGVRYNDSILVSIAKWLP